MPAPPTHWPAWRIVDLVATIALFVVYAVGVLGLLYFSIFWVMATDSCGANDCDYDKLGTAYVLNDIGGVVVYVVALVVAVILVVRRRPAFWLPLVGGAVQVGLLLAAMSQLSGVTAA
ncbi:Vitamin K epoxide reductase family protein [Tsukamurella hominis]